MRSIIELPELSSFIVTENYSHHKDKLPSRRQINEESTSILKEEQRHIDYSFVIAARYSNHFNPNLLNLKIISRENFV